MLSNANAHLHMYGKSERANRKLGHINVFGKSELEVDASLEQLADFISECG